MLINTVSALITLAVINVVLTGLGRFVLHIYAPRLLLGHWAWPTSLIFGTNILYVTTQALLLIGDVQPSHWRALSILLMAAAVLSWIVFPSKPTHPPFKKQGHTQGQSGISSLLYRIHAFSTQRLTAIRSHWKLIQVYPSLLLLLAIPLIALCINVIIASAPSTKIDELHYHMLVPRRILEDKQLLPYLLPYEASAPSHLQFQIMLTIFHAWNYPDGGNLVSVLYEIALAIFIYSFCKAKTNSRVLSLLASSSVFVGLYPAVHHTTSGPHALGDLALALAGVSLLDVASFSEHIGKRKVALLTSAYAAMAASTKLSLWPIAILISLVQLMQLLIQENNKYVRLGVCFAAAFPWLLCHTPMIFVSLYNTGTPFGPFFMGRLFGRGLPMDLADLLEKVRRVNQIGILSATMNAIMILPLTILLAFFAFAGPFRGALNKTQKYLLCALVLFQATLIYTLLPHQIRFMSGLVFVVLIGGVWHLSASSIVKQPDRYAVVAVFVLLVPWLVVQVYYAVPFIRLFTGLSSKEEFLKRYVALYQDFQVLDAMLPKQATLLADSEYRLPSFYAPRPIVYTRKDVYGQKPLYVVSVSKSEVNLVDDRCNEVVYKNRNAIIETYRTPRRAPVRGVVIVAKCKCP